MTSHITICNEDIHLLHCYKISVQCKIENQSHTCTSKTVSRLTGQKTQNSYYSTIFREEFTSALAGLMQVLCLGRIGTLSENKQQTQPTPCQNRTSATLVGGEHSHHCAIPAPCQCLWLTVLSVCNGIQEH